MLQGQNDQLPLWFRPADNLHFWQILKSNIRVPKFIVWLRVDCFKAFMRCSEGIRPHPPNITQKKLLEVRLTSIMFSLVWMTKVEVRVKCLAPC